MASAPDWTPLPHMISPMTEVEGRSALSPEVGTTRVEAFSDSVMAVIVTIMAFELRHRAPAWTRCATSCRACLCTC